DARAVNVETSSIAYVETISGPADDMLDLVAQLAQKMSTGMKLPAMGDVKPAVQPKAQPKGRLQSLLVYSTALVEDGRSNRGKAIELYQKFLHETPTDYAVEQRQRAEQRIKVLSGG